MNRNDLVNKIVEKSHLSVQAANKALNAFTDVITESLIRDENILIEDFGLFKNAHRREHAGRTATGESLIIPASASPIFKASAQLKKTISMAFGYTTDEDNSAELIIPKEIAFNDFLIRCNMFQCRYKQHTLKNIDATVNMLLKDGTIDRIAVSAGFCEECNTFFIMESVYQTLKNKGTLLCRISDEKAYHQVGKFLKGAVLAKESILKQYGYNVDKQAALSELQRHKILEALIVNKIMTKNEIIGYLDFFINQRKTLPRYHDAITKWDKDKEFVLSYNIGKYTNVSIIGISR